MKKEFRKKVIYTRNNQNLDFISKNSAIITDKLLKMDCINKANTIMLYLDFNNEVKTDNLVKKLLSLKKVVATPITQIEEKKLIPSQVTNLENDVEIGTYGIREPKQNYSIPIDIKRLDVVIVPAVAYDSNCYRLGYGGGFYDRFLSNLRNDSITIGIAFDFQIFNDIPREPHDAKLNYVITESRIITPSN